MEANSKSTTYVPDQSSMHSRVEIHKRAKIVRLWLEQGKGVAI
jgi:hypothetical protein